MNNKQKKNLYRIIIAAIFMVVLFFIKIDNQLIDFILNMIPYLIVGYDILIKAFKGILNKEIFDENFLMAIATIGAILLGDYHEGVAVMLFYQIGELFQSYAVNKSRRNISDLMDIRPDYANLIKDGNEEKVDPYEVNIGDEIIVKVGEKIPLDGIIIKGSSSLNTTALTGESYPRIVKENDEVNSGSINMESPIYIKVNKIFEESTVSKILDLVENATSNKSKSEDFISKFAHYYTPVVCFAALFLCIIPPLFNHFILNQDYNFLMWINRALTFLVISCPCALVISIPLSFFAGIGGASREGILIKGSNYLEKLSKCKYAAFDKTGTMTKGVFEVGIIHNTDIDENELLKYAAHAEIYSSHPIGKSIIKEYGKNINKDIVESTKEIAGNGIIAKIDNKNVIVGNERIMHDNNIEIIECHEEGNIIHVAIDNKYVGHIHIGDKIKDNSIEAIKQLKLNGIKKTIMLTGDENRIAQDVANKIGIDQVYSELLPQDKVEILQDIIKNKEDGEVLFVGDGINDAPVISLADIGISMGALGSDAAIEAADIVLMDDDPLKLSKAIKIARKCMRIVYENIAFAIGVKIIALILGALGITNMWMAIFADVGVMIVAVINAIRALNVKYL